MKTFSSLYIGEAFFFALCTTKRTSKSQAPFIKLHRDSYFQFTNTIWFLSSFTINSFPGTQTFYLDSRTGTALFQFTPQNFSHFTPAKPGPGHISPNRLHFDFMWCLNPWQHCEILLHLFCCICLKTTLYGNVLTCVHEHKSVKPAHTTTHAPL